MDIFSFLAEARIRQALKDGEFEDLPGKGKQLHLVYIAIRYFKNSCKGVRIILKKTRANNCYLYY